MADPFVPSSDKIPSTRPIGPTSGEEPKTAREPKPFARYMEGGTSPNPLIESGTPPKISPFELAHGKIPAPGPTLATIQNQAKAAHGTLGDIANQLNTPKLKLKQSTKYLLKNKLHSARGHIRSASNKLGAPEKEETASRRGGALGKFLGLITSGQRQLEATQQHLTDVAAKGDQMRPADMLLIQIKLSKAQQELEYSSMLLGKAVDDLKMMMNIQL